ncbi:prephenate dehydrogenase [Aestuariimicrobium soli]|uniref:prephenate dehydrogenase n=1 Tax=Aestuariimicrobium soli TaxID=2035834 RepID=UPI003EBA6710
MTAASSVVIIGVGLVGASIGRALVTAGRTVHVEDRVPSHAMVAASLGAGTVEAPDPTGVALVVVAVPPDVTAATVAQALVRFPHAVVTDVASVKSRVLRELADLGADVSRYCGSHPMAGSQHTGPLTADAELFVDRTWVVTPHRRMEASAQRVVEHLIADCGARAVEMLAELHDEAVAQVSHVPQLMSSLTAGHLRSVPATHLALAGQGIRDVTRIAGSDPVLWRQIIGANREAIRTELLAVRDDLDALLADFDDPQAIEDFIARGRVGALSLPGKHGAPARALVPVVIAIPDEPGSLARLFQDIEAAGVNVEDLQIEHDPERQVGYLAVQVVPEGVDRLTAAMQDAGWQLR